MEKLKIKHEKPEAKIQKRIVNFLEVRGWFVKVMHGNLYQAGFPDLFATHRVYGIRLIEVKDPNRKGDLFTKAQYDVFPKLIKNGSGVWILVGDTEREYKKLFQECNFHNYLLGLHGR